MTPQTIAAHAIYLTVREQYLAGNLTHSAATPILTQAMALRTGFMKVVGITKEALEAYQAAGFIYIKGIQRAHLNDRIITFSEMLGHPEPMTAQEMANYYEERDQTVLALSSQNKNINDLDFIPIDDPSLFAAQRFGFYFTKKREGAFLRGLASEHLNSGDDPLIANRERGG